jgi:hypothetical protein
VSSEKPVKSKGRKAAIYRGAKCLNCKHPLDLSNVYCSYCGQLNTTKQLSLKDFFGEFIGSVITYDSRLRYTVKDLLFKPGTITKNYVSGQRLKYANPFRFFLSVSIIYFLVQGLISTFSGTSWFKVNGSNDKDTIDSIFRPLNNQANVTGQLNEDLFISDSLIVVNQDTITINQKKQEKEYKYISEADLDTIQWSNRIFERFVLYNGFYEKTEIKDPAKALDSLKHNNSRFNRWVYDKNGAIDRVKENPYGFLDYLMGKIPFFLFFFTPFFAIFFWLVYSKRKYTFIEHMIFIFHIFSFLFLAMLISLIPDTIIGDQYIVAILFGIIGPFYFYKALRNFYKQSRLITILKFVFFNFVFMFGATLAAMLFFSITAAVY